MKIDHIYVVHYKKLTDRKKYLEETLPKFGIPFEFRSLYDRSSPELFDSKYFDPSEKNLKVRNSVVHKTNKPCNIGQAVLCDTDRWLGYRANALEHYKIFEHVALNTNYQNVLILEDDVQFPPHFSSVLEHILKVLPPDYDVCYIGNGCNLQLPYHTDSIVGLHPQFHSRCTDSYIITKSSAEKFTKTILPFFGAADWDLNYVQALHDLKVYWSTVPAVLQGSQNGVYTSSF